VLPSHAQLKLHLMAVLNDKAQQGHVVNGLARELEGLPDSYDALAAFAERLSTLPLRDDWMYEEPDDLEGILAAADPARPTGWLRRLPPSEHAARIKAAFLGALCGCTLGKPFEMQPTMADLRAALEPCGEWPLRDYATEGAAARLWQPLPDDLRASTREHLRAVPPDDDLNYKLIGMMALERHGVRFTRRDLLRVWLEHLPVHFTFGPERTLIAKAALWSLPFERDVPDEATLERWCSTLNPLEELCGAMIRVDAYGYAAAGNPALAATLAHRDASLTHRRTGVYGAMFAAAAIAAAFVARDPLEMFQIALMFVPQRSRFAERVRLGLEIVASSADYWSAYARIQAELGTHGHCQIYAETATLINSVAHANNVGDGLCKQVMQGLDTDSYGAIAGSILGAYFGPGHLEARWTAPFDDTVRTALAGFHAPSLSDLAHRMGALSDLDLEPSIQ
jgi:ADP-ribosylglycohydrolase